MLTLVDDPFYPENPMQSPFDAEGVATYKKNLIENGVLKTLLYDLTTAKKAGKTTTGNSSKADTTGGNDKPNNAGTVEPDSNDKPGGNEKPDGNDKPDGNEKP